MYIVNNFAIVDFYVTEWNEQLPLIYFSF